MQRCRECSCCFMSAVSAQLFEHGEQSAVTSYNQATLYRWCTVVSATFKYDEPYVENVTRHFQRSLHEHTDRHTHTRTHTRTNAKQQLQTDHERGRSENADFMKAQKCLEYQRGLLMFKQNELTELLTHRYSRNLCSFLLSQVMHSCLSVAWN